MAMASVYLSAPKLQNALPDLPILFQAVPSMECAHSRASLTFSSRRTDNLAFRPDADLLPSAQLDQRIPLLLAETTRNAAFNAMQNLG